MNTPFANLPIKHTAKELHAQALAQKALEDFWAGRHPSVRNQLMSPHQALANAPAPIVTNIISTNKASLAETNPPGLHINGSAPQENKPGAPITFKFVPAPTNTSVAVVSAKPHHPVREAVGAGALFIGCVLLLLTVEFVRALFRPLPLPAPPAVKQLPVPPPAK